jgi:hypothetical protein
MTKDKALTVFENFKIRRIYDEKADLWYFSVVDIIAALMQQPDYQAARKYWKVLKNRMKKEGSESVIKCNRLRQEGIQPVTNCYQLKMEQETRNKLIEKSIGMPLW